jgi:hypothetical protein
MNNPNDLVVLNTVNTKLWSISCGLRSTDLFPDLPHTLEKFKSKVKGTSIASVLKCK